MAKNTKEMEYNRHFNSIKVRLKHFMGMSKENPLKFQFHKGTIKTVQEFCRIS